MLAAVGFGAMAVLAKLAYDAGASVPTVLAVRFALAAAVLWILVAQPWRRGVRSRLPRRRAALAGLALGAVLYAAESGLFFSSLRLGDRLAPIQLAGGALVLAAVLVLQMRLRPRPGTAA
jgi:drug/metabolite transporter (DMT)-like permease